MYYKIFACFVYIQMRLFAKQQVDKRNDYCFFCCKMATSLSVPFHSFLFSCSFALRFCNFEYAWLCVFLLLCWFTHFYGQYLALVLTFLLTHFLVNVLWQCFFEVSSFVTTYCSLEEEKNTHPLCWLLSMELFVFADFCELKNWHSAKAIRGRKIEAALLFIQHWIWFPVEFYCQQNSDVRRFLSLYFACYVRMCVSMCVCVASLFVNVRQYIVQTHLTHMSLKHTHTHTYMSHSLKHETSNKNRNCQKYQWKCIHSFRQKESYKYFGSWKRLSEKNTQQEQQNSINTQQHIV